MRIFNKFTAAAALALAILSAGVLETNAQSRKDWEKEQKRYEKQQKKIQKENERLERERERAWRAQGGRGVYNDRGSVYNNRGGVYDNRVYDNRGSVYDNRSGDGAYVYDNRGRTYDPRYDNQINRSNRDRATAANYSSVGYQNGYIAGQNDRRRNRYNESNVYRNTPSTPYQGDPSNQDYMYRQGYLQGYNDGYNGRRSY